MKLSPFHFINKQTKTSASKKLQLSDKPYISTAETVETEETEETVETIETVETVETAEAAESVLLRI